MSFQSGDPNALSKQAQSAAHDPIYPEIKALSAKIQKVQLHKAPTQRNASDRYLQRKRYQVRLNRCISSSKLAELSVFATPLQTKTRHRSWCLYGGVETGGFAGLACYDTTQYPAPFGSAVV